MRRTRIGLLLSAVILVIVGSLPGVAVADPTPTGPTDNGHDMLSGILHGEGIVQTKKGPIRVAMQNGTATTATDTSLTVRSTDGYTKTWTLAQNAKIFDNNHKSVQPDALQSGMSVVVGGPIATSGGSPGASPSATYTAQFVMIQSSPTPAGSPS